MISPGVILLPPPMIEAALAVWCGARNGLVKITSSDVLQREWILVMLICSDGVGSGSKPPATLAKSVFPTPGGPESRILCLPAMAIVIARLTKS